MDEKHLKPRLMQLLHLLPKHNCVISRAAVECGYSKDYAQKRLPKRLLQDDTFCRAMEAKRQEFMRETGWDEAKWRTECVQRYEEAVEAGDRTAICALLKMLGQNVGAFTQDNTQRGVARQIQIVLPPPEQPREHVPCTVVNMPNRAKALVER